jgi:hypothetical protein
MRLSALHWLRTYGPRILGGVALAAVAVVAGRISYMHIESFTLAEHQPRTVAMLAPFAVDGLIVVGSVVLLQAIPGQEYLGWLGVGPGVAASVFANVESGIHYGVLSAAWAGVPAAFFALACFIFERWLSSQVGRGGGRGGNSGGSRAGHALDPETSGQCPHGVAGTVADAVVNAFLHGRDCIGEVPSQRQLAASFGQSRDKVAALVGSLNGSGPRNEGEPGNE